MDSEFTRRVSIDHVHELVHEGRLFFVSDVRTTGSPVVYWISIGSECAHIAFDFETSLKVGLQIIEGVTITGAGTPLLTQSYNREHNVGCSVIISYGPTYTGGAIFRVNQSGFGTNAGSARSGSSRASAEYIFKPNTQYILMATPSGTADIRVIADFYEGRD